MEVCRESVCVVCVWSVCVEVCGMCGVCVCGVCEWVYSPLCRWRAMDSSNFDLTVLRRLLVGDKSCKWKYRQSSPILYSL